MLFARPDLNLGHAIVQAEHGGVQGLIPVGLRASDEVLDAPVFRAPQLMHVPQRQIAVGDRIHQDTEGDDIEELRDVAIARPFHLTVDAVEMLDAPRHLGMHAELGHFLPQNGAHAGHIRAALMFLFRHGLAEPPILCRFEHGECKIFELAFQAAQTQPAGERRVERAGFLRIGQALFERPGRCWRGKRLRHQRVWRSSIIFALCGRRLAFNLHRPLAFFDRRGPCRARRHGSGLRAQGIRRGAHGAHRPQMIGDLEDHNAWVLGQTDEHLAHGFRFIAALALAPPLTRAVVVAACHTLRRAPPCRRGALQGVEALDAFNQTRGGGAEFAAQAFANRRRARQPYLDRLVEQNCP